MARVQAKKTQTQAATKAKPQTQPQVKMQNQGSEVVFALDIGTRSVIGMVGMVEDGKVRIAAVEREEHTERAMVDGQIENIEKVSSLAGKVKKRLEAKTHIRLSRVCVAAAGRALRTKRAEFEMDLASTQLVDDEIISRLEAGAITKAEEAFDAENEAAEDSRRFYLVGYTVCQYFLDDYMISNLKDHRGRHVKVDLIATFLPSEVVESLYTTMNKIGLEVASLTLEPIAAINAAIPENIRLLNLVLVDIGAGTSDIAACTGGSVTGYTMATVAGDEVTETIMKEYLVDFSTAEAVKAQLDRSEEITFSDILGMEHTLSRDEIFQCIQGTSGFLCKEIADKILEINGGAPSALFLAGGGSKLAGLKEGLTTALGMDGSRVAIAGNYFKANAYSDEYDLNNPEYATPLGIAVSSGLNMINDSFRVILNNRPAKLFRSGSFTALNLLMMNGYNFRDILGRPGLNLTVTVNGARKVFYGTSSEPATLLINQKEGKLSEIIHAGDSIDFVPAVQGVPAKACLRDVDGATNCLDITLNGIHVPLETPLNNGDVIRIILPGVGENGRTEPGKTDGAGRNGTGAEVGPEGDGAGQRETEEELRPEGNGAGQAEEERSTERTGAGLSETEAKKRGQGNTAAGLEDAESMAAGAGGAQGAQTAEDPTGRAQAESETGAGSGRRNLRNEEAGRRMTENRSSDLSRPWEEEIPTRGLRRTADMETAEEISAVGGLADGTADASSNGRAGGNGTDAENKAYGKSDAGNGNVGNGRTVNRKTAEAAAVTAAMAGGEPERIRERIPAPAAGTAESGNTGAVSAGSEGRSAVPSALARLGRLGGQVSPVRAEKGGVGSEAGEAAVAVHSRENVSGLAVEAERTMPGDGNGAGGGNGTGLADGELLEANRGTGLTDGETLAAGREAGAVAGREPGVAAGGMSVAGREPGTVAGATAVYGEPGSAVEIKEAIPVPKVKDTIVFQMNGSPLELPKKADGRPYYLMDMIQYSGINLEKPKGVVKLMVNGAPGMFQQTLKEGDVIRIEEERR